ncbi:MAG: SBBP repeat-containing protein [Ignavibacteria bacterium]
MARYNGSINYVDQAYSIAVDGSGNVYVTGYSGVIGSGADYATIKYNPSGVQLWVQRYNGPGNLVDVANSIAVDGTGSVCVTGYSEGSGTGNFDYATIKYNSSGVQQWVARYNGPGNNHDYAYSIAVDASGNVYVTGSSTGSGTDFDYVTIKYNLAGIQQWVAIYNGSANSNDGASSIVADGSGNVYVTGYSGGSGTGADYVTIKYNLAGIQQWAAIYNGSANSNDIASSIAVDGPGNIYVTGKSFGSGTLDDYVTIKYNSSGIQQWAQRYNGPPGNANDYASSIVVDSSGNVYVTGSSENGLSDYATIKYNSSGVQQWVQRYDGPVNSVDQAYSIKVDGSANVYVTGRSYGGATSYDYATIKYNSAGVQQWLQRYNGPPGNDEDAAYAVVVDGTGIVYVTGGSVSIDGYPDFDYATIKYSQNIGIQPISNEIPKSFSLKQNYPNPFNPATNIKFDLSKSSLTKLIVHDILGREIVTLVNQDLKAGSYNVDWDATNRPGGVYFYKLLTDGFMETKKMILVK